MKGVIRDTGKNEILLFVTTWMDLSGTELNEVSQYTLSYMWNLKQQQQLDKQKQAQRSR